MLLIILIWQVGLVAVFKEAVVNLNSQVNKHIQVLEIFIDY